MPPTTCWPGRRRWPRTSAPPASRTPTPCSPRLQLPLREAARAVELAHDLGLHAIATVFDLPLLAPACTIGLDALKTASPDLVHKPLLEAIMATGLPMIVSTGAATAQEVARTIGWLAPAADRLAVLQCVSCYPTAPTDAAVGAIAHLAQLAPGPVGYSDHTTDEDTGALAVSLGACVLEKHLTLDRSAPGPDHAASLEPGPFARYVALCRQAHRRQWRPAPDDPRTGQGLKALLPVEAEVRRLARRSIVAATDLPAGHTLGPDDLAYKRPAGGLEPWQDADLLGRTLARPVAADEPILFEHLAPAARARPHAP
ncbi:MAG: N-acetylneuraminate synthase [Phycisphaerales bacterium]|nr:MAG: N-acetylneuraminate synthase [Phycisphaerales bacterium]